MRWLQGRLLALETSVGDENAEDPHACQRQEWAEVAFKGEAMHNETWVPEFQWTVRCSSKRWGCTFSGRVFVWHWWGPEFHPQGHVNGLCWFMLIISALWRVNQDDPKLKVILSKIESSRQAPKYKKTSLTNKRNKIKLIFSESGKTTER